MNPQTQKTLSIAAPGDQLAPADPEILATTLSRSAPRHSGQWEFQLVLRTEVRDKVPTTAEVLVVRVL